MKHYYLKSAIVVFIVIVIDLISKYTIKNFVLTPIIIINDFFSIHYTTNPGAAWGILPGQTWVFVVITIFALALFVYFLKDYKRINHWLPMVAISLMIGGTLGNFYERIRYKEVVDFLDFNIFGYDYPSFNVADSALVIGVAMLIIVLLFEKKLGHHENV
jgi:signal peptidase II